MHAAQSSRRTIALMFHALGDATGPGVDELYTLDMPRFTGSIELCKKLGRTPVSARDWLAGRDGVIFTFDDGHDSNYHLGVPALRAAGGSGDFFVNPRQVGTRGYATWTQLREMAEQGMSIQSHGLDHRRFLTELSPTQLREDLRVAREEIEQHVGQPVTLLAPAGGRSPSGLAQIARECGYTHVFGSRPGEVIGGDHTLCRLAITRNLELGWLESGLRGGRALRRAQLRYDALHLAKRLLGDRRYERMRALFVRAPEPLP